MKVRTEAVEDENEEGRNKRNGNWAHSHMTSAIPLSLLPPSTQGFPCYRHCLSDLAFSPFPSSTLDLPLLYAHYDLIISYSYQPTPPPSICLVTTSPPPLLLLTFQPPQTSV